LAGREGLKARSGLPWLAGHAIIQGMEDFSSMVTRTFAFLVDKYGFQLTSGERRSSLDSITYEKKPVIIEFGWYKGEIDINIRVDVENEIFRPYRSRTFDLSRIALRQDKNAYRNAPRFPNYITTLMEAETWLQFEACIMKRFCKPILRGDIHILEEITKER
jgi:hypothetical protein